MKKSPQDGGCWYCHNDTEPLFFSIEFDTYIHRQCILDTMHANAFGNKYDPENEIFVKEFNL